MFAQRPSIKRWALLFIAPFIFTFIGTQISGKLPGLSGYIL
ncbi:hypothetical protein FLA_2265 [Filimonas lacunae]|nr:hypothetical protein FLA_2265 [Filimonas lacunae]